MSSIFVHIGQCGNQLSMPLWKHFTNPANEIQPFLSLDKSHRSIHIDSEPKVIKSLPTHFKIRNENVVVGKRGRGSNFAMGFNGLQSHGDDHMLENSLHALRRETERCDTFTGTVVCHSLSGGTGSGMGCRVIEAIRDEYPCRNILSCAVVPCASGESPLQNYNSLLALNWLQTYADATVLLLNDSLITRLSSTSGATETPKSVSFKSMNQLAANYLYGAFAPTETLSTKTGTNLGQEPWELVRTIAPMPSHKFIILNQQVSAKMSWEDLVSRNLQRHPKVTTEGLPTHCLASTIIARGDKFNTFLPAMKRGLDKKIKKSLRTVAWNPYPLDIWTNKTDILGSSDSSSVTMATNSSNILDPFDSILSHSLLKLEAGAYLHWYQRYGITQDIFEESIESLHNVMTNYKEFS